MMARPGSVVLVAGKGHEPYQEVKGVRHHFDDREECRRHLHSYDLLAIRTIPVPGGISGKHLLGYISFRAGLYFRNLAADRPGVPDRESSGDCSGCRFGEEVRNLGLEGQMQKKGTPPWEASSSSPFSCRCCS